MHPDSGRFSATSRGRGLTPSDRSDGRWNFMKEILNVPVTYTKFEPALFHHPIKVCYTVFTL